MNLPILTISLNKAVIIIPDKDKTDEVTPHIRSKYTPILSLFILSPLVNTHWFYSYVNELLILL